MIYGIEDNAIAACLRGQPVRHGRGRPVAGPSRKNLEVLAYMREFFEANDQLPPVMRISRNFGWASLNAAQLHVDALIRHGLIERNAVGKLRFARKDSLQKQ